jgi:hypothetical protein
LFNIVSLVRKEESGSEEFFLKIVIISFRLLVAVEYTANT